MALAHSCLSKMHLAEVHVAMGALFKGRVLCCPLCIPGTRNAAGSRSVLVAFLKKRHE